MSAGLALDIVRKSGNERRKKKSKHEEEKNDDHVRIVHTEEIIQDDNGLSKAYSIACSMFIARPASHNWLNLFSPNLVHNTERA